ncbi:hypothetical protein BCR34DRAFT_599081 [Clohesyomyces aquaticus]|uniref:Uncharacterized protein n=1 Tax=Clohesyomyces aquaticus TaxID=1231657 RepID=A0A1Y1ZWD0_9PLEO|nr:hypothetical protein BCR34DRAFT_599081 [Clohesyomyces aquaticus]
MPPPHATSPLFFTLLAHTLLSGTFAFLLLLYSNYLADINPSRAAFLWPYLHYPIVVAGVWSKITGYLTIPFLVSIAFWTLGWALLFLGGFVMWLGRVVTWFGRVAVWAGLWVEAGRVVVVGWVGRRVQFVWPRWVKGKGNGKNDRDADAVAFAGVRRIGKVKREDDQHQSDVVTGVELNRKGAKKARMNMRVRKRLRRGAAAEQFKWGAVTTMAAANMSTTEKGMGTKNSEHEERFMNVGMEINVGADMWLLLENEYISGYSFKEEGA